MAYSTYRLPFGHALTPWVKRLLLANIVVFILTSALGPRLVFDWFAFQPRSIIWRPWGVITYMFLHAGLWHLFFNMLVLFFFGPPLEERWGSREFIKFYMLCGFGGVALSFLLLPNSVVGASAAVYGIMLAFAMAWPNAPIYLMGLVPVKAKWLVAFLFAVSFIGAMGGSADGVAHAAHLGGFIAALVYLKSDWRVPAKIRTLRRSAQARRFAIVPGEGSDEEPKDSPQGRSGAERRGRLEREEAELLDAVDRVLDKISAEGMSSLTADERKLLDEVSRRRRTN
jgi:membrane associated rhomboid family serine protease